MVWEQLRPVGLSMYADAALERRAYPEPSHCSRQSCSPTGKQTRLNLPLPPVGFEYPRGIPCSRTSSNNTGTAPTRKTAQLIYTQLHENAPNNK